ncbi:hypothetical protein Plhal304r1_c004g0017741 [Plasmopara halstedii]
MSRITIVIQLYENAVSSSQLNIELSCYRYIKISFVLVYDKFPCGKQSTWPFAQKSTSVSADITPSSFSRLTNMRSAFMLMAATTASFFGSSTAMFSAHEVQDVTKNVEFSNGKTKILNDFSVELTVVFSTMRNAPTI